jgi:hypothetical protein
VGEAVQRGAEERIIGSIEEEENEVSRRKASDIKFVLLLEDSRRVHAECARKHGLAEARAAEDGALRPTKRHGSFSLADILCATR